VEEALGTAEVRCLPRRRARLPVATFCLARSSVTANCGYVAAVRSYEGTLDPETMKEDVREVNAGYECGIGVDKLVGR